MRSFSTADHHGLINSTATDMYYAQKLDLPGDLRGFTQPGLMWDALQEDAKVLNISPEVHLSQIKSSAEKFLREDGVYNREELLGTLHEALSDEGTFTLLLGGKSVGKSMVLRSVNEQYTKADKGPMVVQIDARRTGPDLAVGIVSAIQALDHAPGWRGVLSEFHNSGAATVFSRLAGVAVKYGGGIPGVDKVIEALFKFYVQQMTPEKAIENFVAVAAARGRFPCLFVDEANLAFAVGNKEDNKRILELLVMLTKQSKQLNVLFASSEHAYPFRLQQDLGFNLSNLTRTVFAGEVHPVSMRELLVKHWGMGEGLAGHCLAAYGGHVLLTSNAISELSLRKEQFAAENMVPVGLYGCIMQCFMAEAGYPGMKDLMRKIAVHGWVSIDDHLDPRAEILSKNNVAGVVDNASLVVGLPRSVWGDGANYGLIPASQQVRLMIAKVLSREDKKHGRTLLKSVI